MLDVVPCPTPTSATTEATPMMTPSIVRAARSRPCRSAREREPDELEQAHDTSRPSRMCTCRVAAVGHLGVVRDEDDRAARGVAARGGAPAPRRRSALSRLPVGSSARISAGSRHERAGDGDALLLAAGELARLVVHAVAEAQALERGRRARGALAPPTPW